MDKNKKIYLTIGVSILLLILGIQYFNVLNMGSIKDTAQYYENNPTDLWEMTLIDHCSGSITLVNVPSEYATASCIRFAANSNLNSYTGDAHFKSKFNFDPQYFAFTAHGKSESSTYDSVYFYVDFYNATDDTQLASFNVETAFESYHDFNRFEFIKTSNTIYMYVDGVEQQNKIVTDDPDEVYVDFRIWCRAESQRTTSGTLTVDDISTSSVIGANREWNEMNDDIIYTYGVRAMKAFPTAEYKLNVYRVSDNEMINETIIPSSSEDKAAGIVVLPRYETFGENWGMYKIVMTKDGTTMADEYFNYGYTGSGYEYTPVVITTYCNVDNAIIDDEDNSGGEVNSMGFRYLTPKENGDDIYPISVDTMGESGEIQVKIDADSTYVTSSNVTITNLTESSYTVLFDGTSVETISGVSEYVYIYNSTDFNKILKLSITTVTVPSSGGSGGGTTTVPTTDVVESNDVLIDNQGSTSTTEIQSSINSDGMMDNNQLILGFGFMLMVIVLYGIKKMAERKK